MTSAAAPPAGRSAPSSAGSSGPGLGSMMMQGAALGAGAAVGSSMVHGAMGMMSGGSKEESRPVEQSSQGSYAQQPTYQTSAYGAQEPQAAYNPCGNQLQDFLNCTQN